ncbi:MAG: hypothetical protein CEN87_350 [Parcubacteria group bacterium Licking1014_1]|nr:MAG: hypothetical protein CEN87_350 [Parcubacteria group bacterium Licking1014_1]
MRRVQRDESYPSFRTLLWLLPTSEARQHGCLSRLGIFQVPGGTFSFRQQPVEKHWDWTRGLVFAIIILMESENKKNKVKKVLPAIALVSSFYYSFLFMLGLVLGYIVCKIFYKKFVESGKVDLVFIDCGKWKIHLHHWIMGIIFLALVWVIDWFYLPKFFVGVVGGIIIHDIYDFNDWYKVFLRNNNKNSKE